MRHELARLRARVCEAKAIDNIVQAHLEHLEECVGGLAGLTRRLCEKATELALEHAIGAAHLLLLAQLQAAARHLADARGAVLTGARVAPLDGALGAHAALALQE